MKQINTQIYKFKRKLSNKDLNKKRSYKQYLLLVVKLICCGPSKGIAKSKSLCESSCVMKKSPSAQNQNHGPICCYLLTFPNDGLFLRKNIQHNIINTKIRQNCTLSYSFSFWFLCFSFILQSILCKERQVPIPTRCHCRLVKLELFDFDIKGDLRHPPPKKKKKKMKYSSL